MQQFELMIFKIFGVSKKRAPKSAVEHLTSFTFLSFNIKILSKSQEIKLWHTVTLPKDLKLFKITLLTQKAGKMFCCLQWTHLHRAYLISI